MACFSKKDKMGCLHENRRCMWLTTHSDPCSGSSGFGMCVYIPHNYGIGVDCYGCYARVDDSYENSEEVRKAAENWRIRSAT